MTSYVQAPYKPWDLLANIKFESSVRVIIPFTVIYNYPDEQSCTRMSWNIAIAYIKYLTRCRNTTFIKMHYDGNHLDLWNMMELCKKYVAIRSWNVDYRPAPNSLASSAVISPYSHMLRWFFLADSIASL